jgi:hypothetical protein
MIGFTYPAGGFWNEACFFIYHSSLFDISSKTQTNSSGNTSLKKAVLMILTDDKNIKGVIRIVFAKKVLSLHPHSKKTHFD